MSKIVVVFSYGGITKKKGEKLEGRPIFQHEAISGSVHFNARNDSENQQNKFSPRGLRLRFTLI